MRRLCKAHCRLKHPLSFSYPFLCLYFKNGKWLYSINTQALYADVSCVSFFVASSFVRFYFPCHHEARDESFSLTVPIAFLSCLDISSVYFFEAFEQSVVSDSSSLISLQATGSDNDFLVSFTIGNHHLVEDFMIDFSSGEAPLLLRPNTTKK